MTPQAKSRQMTLVRRQWGSRRPLLRICAGAFLLLVVFSAKRALGAVLSRNAKRERGFSEKVDEACSGAAGLRRSRTITAESARRRSGERDSRRALAFALRDARQKECRRSMSGSSQEASSDDEHGRSRGPSLTGRSRSLSTRDYSSSEDEAGEGQRFVLARKPKGSVQDMDALTRSFAIQCCERPFAGRDARPPVKLVVFDFDETLTIATFMPESPTATIDAAKRDKFKKYNFDSPWAKGNRIAKLKVMLEELSRDRTLAVLSRNSAGVEPVLDLLRIAELDVFFAAVWVMPSFPGRDSGAYRVDTEWTHFSPPLGEVEDHKADVVHHLARRPAEFFPQLGGSISKGGVKDNMAAQLSNMRPEEVVLVDDNGANFRSDTGLQVLRYAKVARYDAPYRAMGTLHEIGGIGARDASDYDKLVRFVNSPWQFSEEQG